MRRRSARRGYAMVLVLVFIALMLSFYGVAHRHIAAAIRIEKARTLRAQRDEGSVHALAQGLTVLETGLPPTDPYVAAVTIDTSTGPRSFTLTFTSEGDGLWSVRAEPTGPLETPPPLPASLAEGG